MENVNKIIEIDRPIDVIVQVLESILSMEKFKIKKEEIGDDSFLIESKEPINWLSVNFPVRLKISGLKKKDTVVLTFSISSKIASVPQSISGSNQRKLYSIIDNFLTLIEE